MINESLPKSLHAALHKVWTKAVGTRDYKKAEWLDLEKEIFNLQALLKNVERNVVDELLDIMEERRRDERS